jgi:hypothetical protein
MVYNIPYIAMSCHIRQSNQLPWRFYMLRQRTPFLILQAADSFEAGELMLPNMVISLPNMAGSCFMFHIKKNTFWKKTYFLIIFVKLFNQGS